MTEAASVGAPKSVPLAGFPSESTVDDNVHEAGEPSRLRELVRFLPDLGRLLVDLTRDRRVPLRAKLVAGVLGVCLFSPLDLVPDVLPGASQVDDLALAFVALRLLCRSAGYDVLHDLWRGSADGFVALLVVAGVEK